MCTPRRSRGLTLIEIAVTLAVLAVLATLSVPSLASLASRHRLIGAAEELALDLAEARFQAAQGGQALHLVFEPGPDWCYAVARGPGCGCQAAQACQLKTVGAADLPGVTLVAAANASFDPAAVASVGGQATWRSAHDGAQLDVAMTALGRARICSPTGVRGYPGC